MSVSVLNARLVLVAALLSTCSETSDDSVQKIHASAGEAVVLPCHIDVPEGNIPTVEWSKEGLGRKNITFLYRNYCETFEEKNKDFQFRTSLFMNKVKNGNISLRISNVRPSDAGKHECSIIHGNKRKVIKTLELIVCAATEPKLSVVDETVQCEVHSSLPQVNMTFLDHQGKIIPAVEPKRHQDSSGCFTFTGTVKRPTASDRVTCRVHQPQIQSRDVQMYFTEAKDTKSCTYGTCAAFVVAVGIGTFLLGFFRKELFSCSGRKIPPLYLQLQEKERIISELREELEHSRSTQSPDAHQPEQPTFDDSPSQPSPDILNVINPHQFPTGNDPKPGTSSNNNHSNSSSLSQEKDTKPGVSPSLSPYHGPVSSENTENEPVRRSKSLFERPDLNFAKLQSRKSFSAGTRNHFSDKEDLSEEHLLPVDHLECDDPLSST